MKNFLLQNRTRFLFRAANVEKFPGSPIKIQHH